MAFTPVGKQPHILSFNGVRYHYKSRCLWKHLEENRVVDFQSILRLLRVPLFTRISDVYGYMSNP